LYALPSSEEKPREAKKAKQAMKTQILFIVSSSSNHIMARNMPTHPYPGNEESELPYPVLDSGQMRINGVRSQSMI